MGMYTGFHIDVELTKDMPEEAINAFKLMTGQIDYEFHTRKEVRAKFKLPMHPLFSTDRWDSLFCCQSAYFIECETMQQKSDKRFCLLSDGNYSLCSYSSLKNCNNEIGLFLDWVSQYVLPTEYGNEVGWYRYEEFNNRTYFSFTENELVERTETVHDEPNL
jgi:hypothetical protein